MGACGILFEGVEVHSLSRNDLVRRGCIQVMEGRRSFAHLTIDENLLTGAYVVLNLSRYSKAM